MITLLRRDTGRTGRKAARLAASCSAGVCIALLSGCSTPDGPESDETFTRQVYVGAGVLASHLKPDTDDVAGTSVEDSRDGGGSATLGYDITPRLSVEGHIASLGEAEIDPADTVGYTLGGVSGLFYGFNDALNHARRNGFAVFGRLGLGGIENDTSGVDFNRANDVNLLAGVGLEVGVVPGLGLRAEFVAHDTDAKYAQLGFVYRFIRQQERAGMTEPGAVKTTSVDKAPVGEPVLKLESEPDVKSPAQALASVNQQDADGDKVPDPRDQCPNTVAGTPVKVDGCPIFDGVVDGINFRVGSDTLTDESIIVLADIAQTLREYPDVRIIIKAHTDNRGNAADNLQLSKRRAIAVARYLIGAGISGSRLRPKAYGESQPRVSNQTAQGRAANRRVEFSIMP